MGTATGLLSTATYITARVPGRLAATATLDSVLGAAPYAGVISAVEYFPDAGVTGADTNSLTLSVINAGTDGAGTTVAATKACTNGVNLVKADNNPITLSATAANLDFAVNQTLMWRSEKVGTGLLDPGGLVRVTFTRD